MQGCVVLLSQNSDLFFRSYSKRKTNCPSYYIKLQSFRHSWCLAGCGLFRPYCPHFAGSDIQDAVVKVFTA